MTPPTRHPGGRLPTLRRRANRQRHLHRGSRQIHARQTRRHPRDEAQQRLSPDGKTILYDTGVYGTDATTGLVIARADGSEAHAVFKPQPDHAMNYAAWTPDGKRPRKPRSLTG